MTNANQPTVREVIEHLAFETVFTPEQIMGPRRTGHLRELRLACLWCANAVTGQGITAIGRAFNRRHSTAIELLRSAEHQREWDPEFRALTDRVVRCFRDNIWEIAA